MQILKKYILILETGYDDKIFMNSNENLRSFWNFDEDDFIIMYAGRLIKEKGINIILNAAKNIESINNKIKFIFVGRGYLENIIKNSKSKNVVYKNSYDFIEMGNVLRTCDIFIYPSISTKYWVEQFGYSVIEAQACQKPTIVTSSGNLPRFVQEGTNGSIIEESNEFELKTKIIWWYNRLKKNSEVKTSLINRFSAQNIALNYKRIILEQDPLFLNDWF